MAPSPPKPWERRTGGAASSPLSPTPTITPSSSGALATTTSNMTESTPLPTQTAPPVPSRSYETTDPMLNNQNSSLYGSRFGNTYGGYGYNSPYSRFGGMGNGMYSGIGTGMYGSSMYGGMGYGGYSGYGGYGGYGGFGGYGGMGNPNDPNSLTRSMEAGTQATFQIIESIVGAFGGFAQMLESTFMATHSSFFAMVSVAEQFGNLRDTLGSILGIHALMRYLRITIAKLRGQPIPPSVSQDPNFSQDSFDSFNQDPNAPPRPPPISKKPLIIFLLAVFGLPYLMGKLIRAMSQLPSHTLPPTAINQSQGGGQLSRAIFDFIPRNLGAEVPLRKGEVVMIISRAGNDWCRVKLRDGREGYVPLAYLEGVHNPEAKAQPIISPPGEQGHAFIEEFRDEE